MLEAGRRKRTGLILGRGAAWLSAAGGLLVIAWWVRSYSASDWLVIANVDPRRTIDCQIGSGSGTFQFSYAWNEAEELIQPPTGTYARWQRDPPIESIVQPTTFWTRAGFRRYAKSHPRYLVVTVVLPHWFVAIPFAIAPACGLARAARRRRRTNRGLCSKCGYDLRGSPGQCPECGAAAGASATSARAVPPTPSAGG
jgi:hypothetical protein